MKNTFESRRLLILLLLLTAAIVFLVHNCTKETIVIYRPFTEDVNLIYPPNSGIVYDSLPSFIWGSLAEAISYQIQLADDAAFSSSVLTGTVSDTIFMLTAHLEVGRYYWRVRAKNSDGIWGDWSEATIRNFRYGEIPDNFITLLSPPDITTPLDYMPVFYWELLNSTINYQIQVASDIAFIDVDINKTVSDTFYNHTLMLNNSTYYWRVRAESCDSIWGDWSEAEVWSFRINNNTEFMELLSTIQTIGTAQDVFVMDDVAYVADGNAELTMIDVSDPVNPWLIVNIDPGTSDFANAVWKAPAEYDHDIVCVADMDGKIAIIDIRQPFNPNSMRNLHLGLNQNLEDLTGMIYQDTIYLFSVNSQFGRRKICFYQLIFDDIDDTPRLGDFYPTLFIDLLADGKGVCFDSMSIVVEYNYVDTTIDGSDTTYTDSTDFETQNGMFVFAAVSQLGLWWYNVSQTHITDTAHTDTLLLYNPQLLGWGDTPSIALSVYASDGFVYVADDRGGLQIFDLPDTIPSFDSDSLNSADPVLVASINTSGRTKDVYVVGNFCFLADGSGGLKIIDVSNPYAPFFLASYSTPYAYGVWADEDYIFIADRDEGLMIFENKVN